MSKSCVYLSIPLSHSSISIANSVSPTMGSFSELMTVTQVKGGSVFFFHVLNTSV